MITLTLLFAMTMIISREKTQSSHSPAERAYLLEKLEATCTHKIVCQTRVLSLVCVQPTVTKLNSFIKHTILRGTMIQVVGRRVKLKRYTQRPTPKTQNH